MLWPQRPRGTGCRKVVGSWQKEMEAFSLIAFHLKETAVFPALSVSMAASLAACAGVSAALGNFQGGMQECWTLHFLIFTCSFKGLNR